MNKAYTDGACRLGNPGLCSCSFVVYFDIDGNEHAYQHARVLPGRNTNNVAEYEALLDLLKWADIEGVRNLMILSDSQLVVSTVNMKAETTLPHLKGRVSLAYGLMVRGGHRLKHTFGHIGVEGNELADKLCNEELDKYMASEEFKKEFTNA